MATLVPVACFNPIRAYQPEGGGPVVFREFAGHVSIDLPCGQCTGCRLERSRQWAVRCMHEAKMHRSNVFLTLTYGRDRLPPRGELCYRDFQLFMKRLRFKRPGDTIRFFMCGEYGDQLGRPHYHALVFNCGFADALRWKKGGSGEWLYVSKELTTLWGHGDAYIGAVSFRSAGYVARYSMKKVSGALAEKRYEAIDPSTGEVFQKQPEFGRMSLKPGIGFTWLAKFNRDVYPKGEVVVNGRLAAAPRYYNVKWSDVDPDVIEAIKMDRQVKAYANRDDNTPARLADKEKVAKARLKFKQREYDNAVRNYGDQG